MKGKEAFINLKVLNKVIVPLPIIYPIGIKMILNLGYKIEQLNSIQNLESIFAILELAESYMDSKSPSKKASEELARELLIAISSALPDNRIVDSDFVPESKKADGFTRPNSDWDDKFRSELISISYVESPDVKI
ncbi:hypothetical protein RJT34_05576 [Clitoria ternatea]|uniref:Uncharacterized protein n=1 Tax=Clitoria ternatea TaxID=43366 RepID=A0AAN9K0S2_CLITE